MPRDRRRETVTGAAGSAPRPDAVASHTDLREPARPAELPADRIARALACVALVLAALYPLAYFYVALRRMSFPFELEWMEGGVVDHVRRLLAGQPLYVEPSLAFTPFTYPPLYFAAGAWVSRVFGVGFAPLRALSFACSLVTLASVFATVRRDTRRALPAALAACLFAASFREGGAWFDLARVDSMYVMFMAIGVWLSGGGRPWLAGALAGAAFGLAALTKQSALFIAAPAAVWLLLADWRRGVPFAAALALVAGGASLALDAQSHGWYRFYVFELPRHHPVIPQLLRGFWTSDLLGTFALALALGAFRFVAPRGVPWRRLGFDLVVLVALILTAYVTKIRVGSFTNLVIPAHLAAALALGWGLGAMLDAAASAGARTPLERFAMLLVLVQFVLCAYKPWRQIPSDADVTAGRQFVQSLGRVPGAVWIPSHPYLAEMSGKPAFAHELAITDVLRPGDTPQHRVLMDSLRAALRARRYDLVILDHTGWLREETEPNYDHLANMFGENEKDLFWPITGYHTRPDFVWAPKRDSSATR